MKECPFCREQIQDMAVKCRYCGEFLNPIENKEAPGAATVAPSHTGPSSAAASPEASAASSAAGNFPFKAWKVIRWLCPLFVILAYLSLKSVSRTYGVPAGLDFALGFIGIFVGITYFLLAPYVRMQGGKSGRFTVLALIETVSGLLLVLLSPAIITDSPTEATVVLLPILFLLLIAGLVFYILCTLQLFDLETKGAKGARLLGYVMLANIVLGVCSSVVNLFYESDGVSIAFSLLALTAMGVILWLISGMFTRLAASSAGGGKNPSGGSVWKWVFIGLAGLFLVGLIAFVAGNSGRSDSMFSADATDRAEGGSDFDAFFKKFGQDEAFQRAHIVFPLEIEGRHGDESSFIKADEWKSIPTEYFVEGLTTIDGVTYKGFIISRPDGRMGYTFAIPETDNGFMLTFEMIDDEWMLVGYK